MINLVLSETSLIKDYPLPIVDARERKLLKEVRQHASVPTQAQYQPREEKVSRWDVLVCQVLNPLLVAVPRVNLYPGIRNADSEITIGVLVLQDKTDGLLDIYEESAGGECYSSRHWTFYGARGTNRFDIGRLGTCLDYKGGQTSQSQFRAKSVPCHKL